MREIGVVGVGQSNFSRGCRMRVPELAFEAFKEAMQDAKLTAADIDASIVCSSMYDPQRSPEGTISDYLDLAPKPTLLVENACTAGTSGIKLAWSLIKSGLHKVVAVIGVEKMSGQRFTGGGRDDGQDLRYYLGVFRRIHHAIGIRHARPCLHG